jgi:hypothetical protein
MPRGGGRLDGDEGLLGGVDHVGDEGVKTTIARTFKQYSPRGLILNQKEEGVKFNEDMVIKCKSMNRKQILRGTRNMKDVIKMHATIWGAKS